MVCLEAAVALRVGQDDRLTLSAATQLCFLTASPSSPAGDTRLQLTLPLAQELTLPPTTGCMFVSEHPNVPS